MPTSGHEDEYQSTKGHQQYLQESNASQLEQVFSINANTLMIWVDDRIIVSFSLIQEAIFSVNSFAWLALLRKGNYFSLHVASFF